MCRIFRRRSSVARNIRPSSAGRESILACTVLLRKGARPRKASPSDRYSWPASLVARVGGRKSTVLLRKLYRAAKEIWRTICLQISGFSRKWSVPCFTVVCLYVFVVEQQGGEDLGSSWLA